MARPEQRRRLWMWLGLAAFGLIVAFGIYTVVHGWLTLLLPMFDAGAGLQASLHLALVGLVSLALYRGLKQYTRRPRPFARRLHSCRYP